MCVFESFLGGFINHLSACPSLLNTGVSQQSSSEELIQRRDEAVQALLQPLHMKEWTRKGKPNCYDGFCRDYYEDPFFHA